MPKIGIPLCRNRPEIPPGLPKGTETLTKTMSYTFPIKQLLRKAKIGAKIKEGEKQIYYLKRERFSG